MLSQISYDICSCRFWRSDQSPDKNKLDSLIRLEPLTASDLVAVEALRGELSHFGKFGHRE